jgi:hypothetical protein
VSGWKQGCESGSDLSSLGNQEDGFGVKTGNKGGGLM